MAVISSIIIAVRQIQIISALMNMIKSRQMHSVPSVVRESVLQVFVGLDKLLHSSSFVRQGGFCSPSLKNTSLWRCVVTGPALLLATVFGELTLSQTWY